MDTFEYISLIFSIFAFSLLMILKSIKFIHQIIANSKNKSPYIRTDNNIYFDQNGSKIENENGSKIENEFENSLNENGSKIENENENEFENSLNEIENEFRQTETIIPAIKTCSNCNKLIYEEDYFVKCNECEKVWCEQCSDSEDEDAMNVDLFDVCGKCDPITIGYDSKILLDLLLRKQNIEYSTVLRHYLDKYDIHYSDLVIEYVNNFRKEQYEDIEILDEEDLPLFLEMCKEGNASLFWDGYYQYKTETNSF